MSCEVHPYATGGEIKTIGLFDWQNEGREAVYARWALNSGRKCGCRPDARLAAMRAVALSEIHAIKNKGKRRRALRDFEAAERRALMQAQIAYRKERSK